MDATLSQRNRPTFSDVMKRPKIDKKNRIFAIEGILTFYISKRGLCGMLR